MKIVPVATNHIELILDDGTVLDVNDGTSVSHGFIVIKTTDSSKWPLIDLDRNTYENEGTLKLRFI